MSYSGNAPPPAEFFCPISHCLMTEPVTLLNTGITFNRTSIQAWMRTGVYPLLLYYFLFPLVAVPFWQISVSSLRCSALLPLGLEDAC